MGYTNLSFWDSHIAMCQGTPELGQSTQTEGVLGPLPNPEHPSHRRPPHIRVAQLTGAGIWPCAHSSLPSSVHYLPSMFNSWSRRKTGGGAMPSACDSDPIAVAGLGPRGPPSCLQRLGLF